MLRQENLSLDHQLKHAWPLIEKWLTMKWSSYANAGVLSPPYMSIDVRHGTHKSAPVDSNLFSAGFNNIPPAILKKAGECFANYWREKLPQLKVKTIFVIAENFSRNKFYLANLNALAYALKDECNHVYIVSPHSRENTSFLDAYNLQTNIYYLEPNGSINTAIGSINADLFILNNDLTLEDSRIPTSIIERLIPDPRYGWYQRSKFLHLSHYNNMVQELCTFLSDQHHIDPWLLSSYVEFVSDVDFKNSASLTELASIIDNMLNKIRSKYQQYGITRAPHVFVKSDNGTHGLGVISIYSAGEILKLNKRKRNKMLTGKGGIPNNRFVIQEGVYSSQIIHDEYGGFVPSEEILYIVNNTLLAVLCRYHPEAKDNLNSPGMQINFVPHHHGFNYIQKLITVLTTFAVLEEGQNLPPYGNRQQ